MAGTLKYVLYRKEELLEDGRLSLAVGQLFRDLMRHVSGGEGQPAG